MPPIEFSKLAYTKMMLHASTNSQTPIHGILIGQQNTVTDAIPVSHSTPTKPIIDMALRFTDAYCQDLAGGTTMLGWYSANERVGDNTPSPVAWKIVGNMKDHLSSEPILAMVTSDSFEAMLRKDCGADGSGKGFEVYAKPDEIVPLEDVTIEDGDWSEVSALVADVCLKGDAVLCDFEKHLDGGVEALKENDWLRNTQVAKLI